MGTDPHIFTNMDRGRMIVAPVFFCHPVINGSQHHVGADQRAVSNIDPSLILKVAAAVDKYLFPHENILSTVCIERREHGK